MNQLHVNPQAHGHDAQISGHLAVEAEVSSAVATTRVVTFDLTTPPCTFVRPDSYFIELALTPRVPDLRICYSDRWGPNRFEPVGSVFMLCPNEALSVRSQGPAKHTSITCELRAAAFHEYVGFDIEWTSRRLEACLDITTSCISFLLRSLAQEASNPGPGTRPYVDCLTGQLAIEIARFCDGVDERGHSGGLASWRLSLIDDRLAQEAPTPTLAELAQLCGMSVRQLTRAFRESRACSIGEHVMQCRIDHAKRLLKSDRSIKSIAETLGYASNSTFAFQFRQAVGLSPREFRQRFYGRIPPRRGLPSGEEST